VTITSDSVYSQDINLVEYAKPADGTSVLVQQTTLTAGVSGAVVLATPITSTTTETAKISIPAGTKFLAENGTQITSGNLESKIVYYGTGTEASLNAFPGGFYANNVIGENGQAIAGGATFVTAGFLAVNMKVGNTVVKSFSQPLQVTMQIRSTFINPNTGTAVKAGDIIPIWSLDEKTGQWKFEANAAITSNGGQLVLQYAMAHLSFWDICWPYYEGIGTTCYKSPGAPMKVTIKTSDASSFMGRVYLATASGQPLVNSSFGYLTTIDNNTTLRFYGSVPNTAGTKVVVTNNAGVKVAESSIFNPCTSGDLTITVQKPAVPACKVMLSLQAKCSNKNIIANISASVNIYMYDGSQYNFYQSAFIKNGLSSFTITNNQKYKVETYYGSTKYAAIIEYKSASFNFTQASTNASITGIALYDPINNVYSTTAFIKITCN
jgi:hypothetical protein